MLSWNKFFLFSIKTIFNLFLKGFGNVAGTNQTSGMELLRKPVDGSRPLTIFAESFVLDVWLFLAKLICLKKGKKL